MGSQKRKCLIGEGDIINDFIKEAMLELALK